jgi:hypothetical protein
VVQAAHLGKVDDGALFRSHHWPRNWAVLRQGAMGPRSVVVVEIVSEHGPEMSFADADTWIADMI